MEIYEAIKNDHIKVKGLFEELLALNKDDDYHMVLLQQIADDLIPHARAEEAVFYNSIRALSDDNSKVMHSFKEHMEAEALLRTLQMQDRMDFDWKSTARKLQEALLNHIQEEENVVFSQAKKMFSIEEATKMGDAFEKMKQEISGHGFMKNTFDLVKNLMPPTFLDKMNELKDVSKE